MSSSDEVTTPRTEYMLTTYDNPFDPFTQWDEWFAFDMHAGYHTPGLLDRVTLGSSEISLGDQHLAIHAAMDEIVRENVSGMHKKVSRTAVQQTASTDEASAE